MVRPRYHERTVVEAAVTQYLRARGRADGLTGVITALRATDLPDELHEARALRRAVRNTLLRLTRLHLLEKRVEGGRAEYWFKG